MTTRRWIVAGGLALTAIILTGADPLAIPSIDDAIFTADNARHTRQGHFAKRESKTAVAGFGLRRGQLGPLHQTRELRHHATC
jgi:hypothetical protein